jgi:hypothetical protein
MASEKVLNVYEKLVANVYRNPVSAWDKHPESQQKREEHAARITAEFRHDLLTHHGLLGHPRGEKAFDLAWEYGEDGTLQAVAFHFQRFITLI